MKRAILIPQLPLILAILVIFVSVACQRPQTSETEVERVENPTLALVIAALPDPFEVVTADGDTIELRSLAGDGEGRAAISVGELRPNGVNLVEEVKARKAAFESLPGGTYLGNRELGTPTGTAFTARGTYEGEAGELEETWVYALHPTERRRLLTLKYT
ncbi:MAG: hypothetical protein OES47_13765, partial [Acidobacteriota bacterium]|nr:hypothetical protein [Acidobacteriota bacterium]